MSDIGLSRDVAQLKQRVDNLVKPEIAKKWASVVSSYMILPGLRFFAPMSVVGATGQAVDLALQNSLGNNANAQFLYTTSGAPYCAYNGTTQYHNIADNAAHDIIGNEAYISSVGLTIGMWVQSRSTPGTADRMFSKGTTTGNARAYALRRSAANKFVFGVSGNGTTDTNISSTNAFVADTWYFVVGVYTPSTSVTLFTYSASLLDEISNVTSIPATLNNSATGLAIAAQADGTQFSDIRASMCFICCEILSNALINSLFEATRQLYGV